MKIEALTILKALFSLGPTLPLPEIRINVYYAYMIKLLRCKRSDPRYVEIRNRHYIPNKGCIGMQLHYLVFYNGELVGIISGASAVWAVRSRDRFFGITTANRRAALPSIINNVVFRLEKNEIPNLGSMVLSLWRKTIVRDWQEQYGVKVHGFETFILQNERRRGALYKADNWELLGETAGAAKSRDKRGLGKKSARVKTRKKLVFGKKVKRTELSTSYQSTWRGLNQKDEIKTPLPPDPEPHGNP